MHMQHSPIMRAKGFQLLRHVRVHGSQFLALSHDVREAILFYAYSLDFENLLCTPVSEELCLQRAFQIALLLLLELPLTAVVRVREGR